MRGEKKSSNLTSMLMEGCSSAVFSNTVFTCIDTVKDHLKSKKHVAKKEAKTRSSDVPSTSRQITLGTPGMVVKSREFREEFVLHYVRMCTVADIPLEKIDKIHPFLEKHCKQALA